MISRTLLIKELRQLRWKLLIGLALLLFVGAGYPFVHESLRKLVANGLPESLPFGIRESLQAISNYTTAIYANWNAKNLVQFGTVFGILFGMSLLASEYELDTMSFLLSTGLSRRTIFWTKAAAGLIALVTMLVIPTLAILPATALSGHQFENLRWLWATTVTLGGATCFYAISIWFSARLRDALKAGLYTGALAILLLLLQVVPGLSALSPWTGLPAYNYFVGLTSFPWLTLLLFTSLTTLILLAAYRHFSNRDV